MVLVYKSPLQSVIGLGLATQGLGLGLRLAVRRVGLVPCGLVNVSVF